MGRHSIPDPEDSADQPEDRGTGGQGDSGFDEQEHPEGSEPDYRDDAYWQSEGEPRYVDDPDAGDGTEYGTEYENVGLDDSPTRALAASPPRPPSAGPQHSGEWDGGEWTGSHRAVETGRRGISVGVIVALVAVVVVVGAVIMWRFFGDALSSRSEASAARCVEGEVAVTVIADPSIAAQIGELADTYNESAEPVGDKCVKVGVRSASSDQVVNGFVDTWPGELGERPALWIPGSSVSEARLEAATGPQTVSDSRSLVTSPVLLAVRPELKTALGEQNWAALPALQTNPTALDAVNLPGWGALRLALPREGDADATYVAAEAVATASAPQGSPATAGATAISTLMAAAPKLADDNASTAMDALLAGSDPADSAVHAVVTTEQQLVERAAALSDAKSTLAGWTPSGAAAVADYPTVLLDGDWLSGEQVSAASEFARYLRKPDAMTELAAAGFRTEDGTPPASDVTDFAPLSAPLAVGDTATRAKLADAVSSPAQNAAVTIMLDQSMNTDEAGSSRVANVATALDQRLKALPPTASVGLWTFDGVSGRSEVALGPLGDPVGGQPRSVVIGDSLRGQAASGGGAVSFTTLRLVYTEAMANFREGQQNSVLVITAGPHTDQSLNGAGLQDFISQTFQQGRPVAVNVIDFGADPDRATWEAVSQLTGGTYQNLSTSAGPELGSALATMVG